MGQRSRDRLSRLVQRGRLRAINRPHLTTQNDIDEMPVKTAQSWRPTRTHQPIAPNLPSNSS